MRDRDRTSRGNQTQQQQPTQSKRPKVIFHPTPPISSRSNAPAQAAGVIFTVKLLPGDREYGSAIDVMCRSTTPVESLMKIYAKQKNVDPFNKLRFISPEPDDRQMSAGRLVGDYGIEDGSVILVLMQQVGGKPVILLYPEQDNTIINVDLQLCSSSDLSAVYPTGSLYHTLMCSNSRLEDLGERHVSWSVTADRCGSLTDNTTQQKYEYLFWEAKTNCGLSGGISTSMFSLDTSRAFCVSRSEVGSWLNHALERYGLNSRERNDCVTYWLHDLEEHAWVLVQFLDEAEYEAAATLTISPMPDELFRVFFVFRGVDERVEDCGGALPVAAKPRRGFVAVEWGAMNLLK